MSVLVLKVVKLFFAKRNVTHSPVQIMWYVVFFFFSLAHFLTGASYSLKNVLACSEIREKWVPEG